MDNKLRAVFAEQEKEDAYRMAKGFEVAVREELGNASYLIRQMRKYKPYNMDDAFEFSIHETIIRIAAEFSIRKHTISLVPYYHSHDFYEIIYVWQGKCGQKLAGETSELNMLEGDLCILTPGMVHAMLPCSESDVILKVIVPNPMMKRLIHAFAEEEEADTRTGTSLYQLLNCNNKIYLYRNISGTGFRLKRLIDDLLHETYWGSAYKMPAVRSLLVLLLVTLGRSSMERTDENLLQKIAVYIHFHIRDANLEELSKQLGYSSRQLRRKIADASGGTFSDLLWKMRIETAAELLNETDMPIEEIIKEVGYCSSAGFYKRFQEMFHMTPASYRKMYVRYDSGRY